MYLFHNHEKLHRHQPLLVLAAVGEDVVAGHEPRLKLPLDHLPERLKRLPALAGVTQCVHQGAETDGRDMGGGGGETTRKRDESINEHLGIDRIPLYTDLTRGKDAAGGGP